MAARDGRQYTRRGNRVGTQAALTFGLVRSRERNNPLDRSVVARLMMPTTTTLRYSQKKRKGNNTNHRTARKAQTFISIFIRHTCPV